MAKSAPIFEHMYYNLMLQARLVDLLVSAEKHEQAVNCYRKLLGEFSNG